MLIILPQDAVSVSQWFDVVSMPRGIYVIRPQMVNFQIGKIYDFYSLEETFNKFEISTVHIIHE